MHNITRALLLLIIVAVASCQSPQEKLKADVTGLIQGFIEKEMKGEDVVIDKFEVLSIDTITPQTKCMMYSLAKSKRMSRAIDSLELIYQQEQPEMKQNVELAELYAGTGNKRQYLHYKKKFEEQVKHFKATEAYAQKIIAEAQQFADSCKTADDETFLDYRVSFSIQASRNNAIVAQDTMAAIVTKDMKLIKEDMYLK